MGTASEAVPANVIEAIQRKARRLYSSAQKILIVIETIRGETLYEVYLPQASYSSIHVYKRNKEFMKAGNKWLAGNVTRETTSDEGKRIAIRNRKQQYFTATFFL
jgi:transposase